MAKRSSSSRKPNRRPSAIECQACFEILDKLGEADLRNATYAQALYAFGAINKRLGAQPFRPWSVDLDHQDGSRLHFVGALLVEAQKRR